MKKGFRNTYLEGTEPSDVSSGNDDKVKGQDMGMLSGNRAATLLNDVQTLDLNRTRSRHLDLGKLTRYAERMKYDTWRGTQIIDEVTTSIACVHWCKKVVDIVPYAPGCGGCLLIGGGV